MISKKSIYTNFLSIYFYFINLVYFSAFLFNKWQGLVPAHVPVQANLDNLLNLLKIETNNKKAITFPDVTENSFGHFFAHLIYSYRNSLVHNRETEFHLTHDSLLSHSVINDAAKQVLENFIIPCLEEIVFYLIIEQNEIVWFDKSKLTLWNES